MVAFYRYIVAGDIPPTISINLDWWDLKYHPLPSPHTSAIDVAKLQPADHSIPETSAVAEQARIPLACITSLASIHPLLTAPYLSPAAAYNLLSVRATSSRTPF